MIWLEIRYLALIGFGRIEKPDVIFARSMFPFGTHMVGRLFKIPVIREVHADAQEEYEILYNNRPLLLFLAKVHATWMRRYLRRSSGLIFNHPSLQKHFEVSYSFRTPSISVYNGADTDAFYPLPQDQALERLHLARDKKYLLFLGSVSPWHGVDLVIEVFLRLRERRHDTELLIVGGDSDLVRSMRERYSVYKDIRFAGRVNNQEALYYINAATACLVPVKKNRVSPGSPIKLFDYIACGKPVISQVETTGYSDLVEGHGLGICCDFTRYEAAAEVIDKFLDKMDPEYFRIHNRRVAETDLNWSKTIEEWLEFARRFQIGSHTVGESFE